MSKKHRIKKPSSVPTATSIALRKEDPGTAYKTFGAPLLILFDKRTVIFLSILFGLYFLMSALKLHTSSVAVWDQMFGEEAPPSLKAGQPRPIRQDEWMVSTPALVGQYEAGMPIKNLTYGDVNAPVILGMPVRDFSMVLRASLWPYFVFDIEHAFSFSWNFHIYFFLISCFLLCMLLTGNQFWLSVFASIFLFLSGANQWWSYSLGSVMINFNAVFLAIIYLLYNKNIRVLWIASGILIISAYSLFVRIYPPWTIPLIYMYTAIFIGFLLQKREFTVVREKGLIRIGFFLGAAIILAFFLFHYYSLVSNTYNILLNTVYPGKRTTNGGDLIQSKLFSEMFGVYITDSHFPQKWLNICEASSVLMFFPVVFYGMIRNYIRERKIDWLQVHLSACVLFLLTWVLIGFPPLLSRISLMSMSPAYRTLPILGITNVFLLLVYLRNREKNKEKAFSWIEFSALAILSFVFFQLVAAGINRSTDDFFKPAEVMLATLLMTIIYLLIRYSKHTLAVLSLGSLLLIINLSNFKVHPLTSGLSSLLDNPLVVVSKEIVKKDPKARWAVFGNQGLANLLKVNGTQVFNGVKAVPIMKDMRILDPLHKKDSVYNRYAHINLMSYVYNDSVDFKLNENEVVNDNYTISMDPCSPRFRQLNVRYFAFTYMPKDVEIRCMTKIADTAGIFIYKRNDL
jgi:hypothetical protein